MRQSHKVCRAVGLAEAVPSVRRAARFIRLADVPCQSALALLPPRFSLLAPKLITDPLTTDYYDPVASTSNVSGIFQVPDANNDR
jgi:hypothetical protein